MDSVCKKLCMEEQDSGLSCMLYGGAGCCVSVCPLEPSVGRFPEVGAGMAVPAVFTVPECYVDSEASGSVFCTGGLAAALSCVDWPRLEVSTEPILASPRGSPGNGGELGVWASPPGVLVANRELRHCPATPRKAQRSSSRVGPFMCDHLDWVGAMPESPMAAGNADSVSQPGV